MEERERKKREDEKEKERKKKQPLAPSRFFVSAQVTIGVRETLPPVVIHVKKNVVAIGRSVLVVDDGRTSVRHSIVY